MNTSVKYELEGLEKLLTSREPVIEEELSIEIDRVKKSLVHEVFSFEDERHLERYIQYHQQAVIRLLDNSYREDHDHQSETVSKDLDDLLNFIERHFAKYFDQDAKVPDAYLNSVRKAMRVNIKKISRELIDHVDHRLLEILLQPISKVNDRNLNHGVTYRKLLYAKEVQKELLRLTENHVDPTHMDEELVRLIYYLNCNSTKSLVYHAHLVNQIVTTSETNGEKLERLSLLIKQVNQAQVRPGIAYNTRVSPLREQVNNYVSEEIEYLQRVSSLNFNVVDSKDMRATTFRVKMEVSVAQLSYLIKIFLATTLIQNSNSNELLRFFSKIIITKRSEGISYDSLRAKFYNVESTTKQAVREILTTLVAHIDKDL